MKAAEHIQLIENLSKEEWGEKWLKNVVAAYVDVANKEGENTCLNSRRPMIMRAFENRSCSLDTIDKLYRALGCEIQIKRKGRIINKQVAIAE